MPDFSRDWRNKASLDYFAPFILLWLSFNSWYRSHYSDIESIQDRLFINKLKTDFSGRNQPFRHFKRILNKAENDGVVFRSNLEMFHRKLAEASFKPESLLFPVGFESALIDYDQKGVEAGYQNLTSDNQQNAVKLELIYVTNDEKLLFSGVLECIYQYRCMLVHGHIDPSDLSHEVAEYAYRVLLAVMP